MGCEISWIIVRHINKLRLKARVVPCTDKIALQAWRRAAFCVIKKPRWMPPLAKSCLILASSLSSWGSLGTGLKEWTRTLLNPYST